MDSPRYPKTKDPGVTLDFGVEWSDFLAAAEGDEIVEAEWLDAHEDLTLVDKGLSGTIHVAYIEGGEPHQTYRVTSHIATAQGRTARQSFYLWVKEQ
jgi:hypothetical protein